MTPATNATANPTVPSMLSVTWTHNVRNTGVSDGAASGSAAAETTETNARGTMNEPITCRRWRNSTTRKTRISTQEKKDRATWNPGVETSVAPIIPAPNATVWEANPVAVMPNEAFDRPSDGQSRYARKEMVAAKYRAIVTTKNMAAIE